MPDRMATPEGVSQLGAEIAGQLSKLRMSTDASPATGATGIHKWMPTINVVLGVFLAASLGTVGAVYKSSTDRLNEIEKTAGDASRGLDALNKDRVARISDVDSWRNKVEDELRIYRVGYSDFRRLEGTVGELSKKLDDGRSERLADKDKVIDAVNSMKTEIALLRQSVEAGRREGRAPFLENPTWNGRPSPLILRASSRRPAFLPALSASGSRPP